MLASFSIIPIGVGEELKQYVAEVVDIIDRSGLNYKLGAMQTTIEGSLEDVMHLILKCQNHMAKIAPRVITQIITDDRKEETNALIKKVSDVEEILGRTL